MFRRLTAPAILFVLACSSPADKPSKVASSVGDRTTAGATSGEVAQMSGVTVSAPMPALQDEMLSQRVAGKEGFAVTNVAAAPPQGSTASLAQRPVDLLAQNMIVRTGNASIRVDSLVIGMARVRALATRVGGYIGNTQVAAQGGAAPSATLEIRVPSSRFDETVAGVEAIGFTEGVQVSAEDVGEQYVDLDARLSNARKLEARLIELLAARTGRLSDVLQVEAKLGEIRGEIESVEGRMRWLRSRASVSTISVTVHEPYPVVGTSGTPNELLKAMRRAWQNFIAFVAGMIALSGIVVPVVAILGGGWVAWKRYSNRTPPVVAVTM